MLRAVSLAVVQLNAQPTPVIERLGRAETLVSQATTAGAKIILLPEVFNTGYEYSDQNYIRAESMDGPTVTWLRRTAANFGVYLAGTLYLRERNDIYNAMLLVAPDGKVWRYDKSYPWAWERAYFRPGRGKTVAETSLGRLGMLICWDVAHTRLWAQYAGQIDAMLICSCPPAMPYASLRFPDGTQINHQDAGPLFRRLMRDTGLTFSQHLLRQATWLGVSAIQAGVTGLFSSSVPRSGLTLAPFVLTAPSKWSHLTHYRYARLETGYFPATFIANASGQVLAEAPVDTEGYVQASVTLASERPKPQGKQPLFGLATLTYWADYLINRLMERNYHANRNP